MINRVPTLTSAEWRRVERVLPVSSTGGKPRQQDREFVTAMLLRKATRASHEECARVCAVNVSSLVSRERRWERDGVLEAVERAGEPAIVRLGKTWKRGWASGWLCRRDDPEGWRVRSGATAPNRRNPPKPSGAVAR